MSPGRMQFCDPLCRVLHDSTQASPQARWWIFLAAGDREQPATATRPTQQEGCEDGGDDADITPERRTRQPASR